MGGVRVNERNIVSYILTKETEISNLMHGTVTEILRLGIDSERGRKQISDMIKCLESKIEGMGCYLDRCIDRKNNIDN